MNRLVLGLLFFVCCSTASAQKIYFIYLQSESDQPFYVKLNNRVHSSTASGYLILSKLKDSTQNFTVGFPGNKWPEQQFAVVMNRKDRGFILKNFGDKGWGLFDMQSMAVQMATGSTARVSNSGGGDSQPVSIFASILAKASDDPSLLERIAVTTIAEKKPVEKKAETVIAKKEEPNKEKTTPPVQPVITKTDPVVVKNEEPKPANTAPVPVATEPVVKKEEVKVEKAEPAVTTINKEEPKPVMTAPVVEQKPVEKTEIGTVNKQGPPKADPATEEKKPVALNEQPVKKDESTAVITALPPVTKEEVKSEPVQKPVVENKQEEAFKRSIVKRRSESSTTEGFGLVFTDETGEGVTDTIRIMIPNTNPVVAPKKEEPKEERKFLEIAPTDVPVTQKEKADVAAEKPVTTTPAKNRCMAVADDADFLKVRKKMAAATSEDNMINEAKKIFKARCFTTQQVKNLNALFLKESSKYNFLDMAYGYVSDLENFPSLETEFKDTYYITRFKAMLR
jgi:hypothetical protein